MAYGETKVYSEGSHYIAIPHTTRPSKKNGHSEECPFGLSVRNKATE